MYIFIHVYIYIYIYIFWFKHLFSFLYKSIYLSLQQDPAVTTKGCRIGFSVPQGCSIQNWYSAPPRSCLAFQMLHYFSAKGAERLWTESWLCRLCNLRNLCRQQGGSVLEFRDSVGTRENHPSAAHATGAKDSPGMVSKISLTKLSPVSWRTPRYFHMKLPRLSKTYQTFEGYHGH